MLVAVGVFYALLGGVSGMIAWYIFDDFKGTSGYIPLMVILFGVTVSIYIESIAIFTGRMIVSPRVMSPEWLENIVDLMRASIPPLWFLFAVKYTDHRWNTLQTIGVTSVYMAFIFGLLLIPTPFIPGELPSVLADNSLLILLLAAVVFITIATFVLGEFFYRSNYDLRPLMYVTLGPIMSFTLYVIFLVLTPTSLLNPVWYTLAATSLGLAVRHNLQEVDSNVQTQILNNMNELVLLVDGECKIKDYNNSVAYEFSTLTTTQHPKLSDLGIDDSKIYDEIRQRLQDANHSNPTSTTDETDSDSLHVVTEEGSSSKHFQVSISQITAPHTTPRFLLLLTDVTENERYKQELKNEMKNLNGLQRH